MTERAANRPPLALTMGEPAGIGGEVTLKSWLRRKEELPPFFVIDDAERLQRVADGLSLQVTIEAIENPARTAEVFADRLPVLSRPVPMKTEAGRPEAANTPAVIAAIETAVRITLEGRAGGVVTNPIHKQVLYDGGFQFPGHTEFLASLANKGANTGTGSGVRPVMMLVCSQLKVVPVTIHLSLAEAIRTLSTESIVESATIVAQALRRDFGLDMPRLAVAGLNPHAGESGSMGTEEEDIIAPAVAALKDRGVTVTGPVPPDSLFTDRSRAGYDAAICMYHDQALIPIKALDFDSTVNVTLGLPFVRTSPDHGTALDIAGSGRASETSLMAALRLADEMAANRAAAGN